MAGRYVLTAAGIAAATALWRRARNTSILSSVLINAAGLVIWWTKTADGLPLSRWTAETSVSLLMANVVCLAAGSIIWSLAGRMGRIPDVAFRSVKSWHCFRGAKGDNTAAAIASKRPGSGRHCWSYRLL